MIKFTYVLQYSIILCAIKAKNERNVTTKEIKCSVVFFINDFHKRIVFPIENKR